MRDGVVACTSNFYEKVGHATLKNQSPVHLHFNSSNAGAQNSSLGELELLDATFYFPSTLLTLHMLRNLVLVTRVIRCSFFIFALHFWLAGRWLMFEIYHESHNTVYLQ